VPPQPRDDVGAAVEEARRLLGDGRVAEAVGVLGGALPIAAAVHGPRSRVVHTLRKQYAAMLMESGQFGFALRELRLLAEESPGGPPAARFRYDAAQCLEHLGETAQALAEYRSLLPCLEQLGDPALPLEAGQRIGRLLLATGDRTGARTVLTRVLLDAQRVLGPHHPLVTETRRTLDWLGPVRM
jgi:eukaryotic-like serine/threonine-protein kinase